MKPIEAFQYLFDHNLPLTLTFPFEEEKGHVIAGQGICHIEKIHGRSKILLGRFNPQSLLHHLKEARSFQADFEIKGEPYFCLIKGSTFSNSEIAAVIPTSLNLSLRRFLRVEPSLRSPVTLYIFTPQHGTVSFTVHDITEQGVSFLAGSPLDLEDSFMCGLQVPVDNVTFIFSNATVVYKIESGETYRKERRSDASTKDILYGLALFPHSEDVKKIRLYIMKRQLEIKRKIQKGLQRKK
jgi:hypothetical protein